MDTEDEYMVDQLEELMRSLKLVQELEDTCGAWRTWRISSLSVEGSRENPQSGLPAVDVLDHDHPEVGDEAVEHAHLDFVAMDLDLVVNNLDAGVQFLEWEEELAHWELDQIAMRLCDPEKDERKQNSLCRIMDKQEDICNWGAYHSGGTWWLDRWMNIPKNGSDIPAILEMARGVDKVNKQRVSDRIVRTAVLCHGPSQDTHKNTCNMLCSGAGKRKVSGRKGRWWTRSAMSRRPWRSTGLARERFEKCRQLDKDTQLNDKFNHEQFHWAKEGHIIGAAWSLVQEETSSREEQENIIRATSVHKPGGSGETAKEIPGKHLYSNLSNTFLPAGHDGDMGQDDGQGAGAVQGHQDQIQGGRGDGLQDHDRGEGGGSDQELQEGGGGEDGQGAWARDGEVPHAQPPMLSLKYPEDSVSPGYAKSRRRRKPDGMVQKRLETSSSLNFKKQILPSVGLVSVPSGGSCVAIERERGSKRGMDQMEGPIARKRIRED